LETSATGTTTGSGTSSAGSSSGSATSSGSSTGAQPIGTLWFGGSAALDATTLAHSGTVSFDHTCPLPGSSGEPMIQGPEAIDGDRNLWALCPGVALCVWTPDQQRQSCTSAPSRVIHLDTLDVLLSAIAFDSHGNLWGTMPFPGSNWRGPVATGVAGYRASDLVPGVPVEPTWFLYPSCQAYSLCDPSSLAFDAEGDLWVGDLEVLLGYSPASLMAATYSGPGFRSQREPLVYRLGARWWGWSAFGAQPSSASS
jgi:hypothetical protein